MHMEDMSEAHMHIYKGATVESFLQPFSFMGCNKSDKDMTLKINYMKGIQKDKINITSQNKK